MRLRRLKLCKLTYRLTDKVIQRGALLLKRTNKKDYPFHDVIFVLALLIEGLDALLLRDVGDGRVALLHHYGLTLRDDLRSRQIVYQWLLEVLTHKYILSDRNSSKPDTFHEPTTYEPHV